MNRGTVAALVACAVAITIAIGQFLGRAAIPPSYGGNASFTGTPAVKILAVTDANAALSATHAVLQAVRSADFLQDPVAIGAKFDVVMVSTNELPSIPPGVASQLVDNGLEFAVIGDHLPTNLMQRYLGLKTESTINFSPELSNITSTNVRRVRGTYVLGGTINARPEGMASNVLDDMADEAKLFGQQRHIFADKTGDWKYVQGTYNIATGYGSIYPATYDFVTSNRGATHMWDVVGSVTTAPYPNNSISSAHWTYDVTPWQQRERAYDFTSLPSNASSNRMTATNHWDTSMIPLYAAWDVGYSATASSGPATVEPGLRFGNTSDQECHRVYWDVTWHVAAPSMAYQHQSGYVDACNPDF